MDGRAPVCVCVCVCDVYIGSRFSCRHVLSKMTDKELVFSLYIYIYNVK